MIIKAYDITEATNRAMEFLRYKDDQRGQIDVVILQEPVSLFWGLIKRKGIYKIKFNAYQENLGEQDQQEDQLSKDGSVQVLDGIIKVTNPIGTGKYATIYAEDPNVDVFVNNTKISKGYIVTEKDNIDLIPREEQPVTSISVQLSQDELSAVLTITRESGKKYYVEDTEVINSLHINSNYVEFPSRRPTLQECVDKLTAENIASKYINQQAILELIQTDSTGSVVAAEGIPPIQGTPGKVKYFFRNESYRNPDLDTDKKVDWLDYYIRPSAKIGDVLAAKVELPVPGRDGLTVTDKVIKAQAPHDIPLISGKGTTLLDEVKVVATMNGRPSLKNGVISVTPAMVIKDNVDAADGKINFDGDIDIIGNVTEGSKILAGGDINVYGNIYGASLYAIGNIRVNGIIMNSKITAGYNVIQNLVVLPKMEKILAQIEKIYQKVFNDAAV
ncbi:MAG: flagellar assembly protein A, partial [Dethiobacteria bacterium]